MDNIEFSDNILSELAIMLYDSFSDYVLKEQSKENIENEP